MIQFIYLLLMDAIVFPDICFIFINFFIFFLLLFFLFVCLAFFFDEKFRYCIYKDGRIFLSFLEIVNTLNS